MLEGILPEQIFKPLAHKVGFSRINEIRIRADKPILISSLGQKFFLSELGACKELNRAIVIEENGDLKTMTSFSSVNIRIPHEVKNCSLKAFSSIVKESGVLNTLIISPPGAGKTTFLRDLVWQISERNLAYNILVLDERGELNIGKGLGLFSDVISFSSKKLGFENGIRSLAPNLIITDELGEWEDMEAVRYASNSGVNIIASVHSDSIESFVRKLAFKEILDEKIFKRFVVLSMREGPGTLEGIYDENFSRLMRW